jgi:outer membrane protein OmpA-like peptidoglycan-associated protein
MGNPIRVSGLSTRGNDVVVGFPDPISILVYHDGPDFPQGIHQYSKFGNTWNYLRPLPIENFKNESSNFSGRLSADGQILILSIKSYGSFGNEDLYISFREGETSWSSPLNLGSGINTFGQEQTPFLSEDNRTLYFSSNFDARGRGKNIYATQRLDDSWENWSVPVELKTANSTGSETGYVKIIEEENLAIFTTTSSSEGMGDFVLIEFEEPEIEVFISELTPVQNPEDIEEMEDFLADVGDSIPQLELSDSLASNEQTIPSQLAESIVENIEVEEIQEYPEENEIVGSDETEHESASVALVEEEIDNEDYLFSSLESIQFQVVDVNSGQPLAHKVILSDDNFNKKELNHARTVEQAGKDMDWTHVLVSSKGYLPVGFSKEEWSNLEEPIIQLTPAVSGASLVLNNIQFIKGTSDFADMRTIQELDKLVSFMIDNQEIRIRLEGHTDNFGDPGLNKALSLQRASRIRNYLAEKSIPLERIRISGWGGTRPLADNSTEDGREINRRVELYIDR